jgi:4-hydroxy-3-polyprenylbenzoate decarboxylase
VILPASPGLYAGPETIDDLIDFVVGKALDVLRIDHALFTRWGEPRIATTGDDA